MKRLLVPASINAIEAAYVRAGHTAAINTAMLEAVEAGVLILDNKHVRRGASPILDDVWGTKLTEKLARGLLRWNALVEAMKSDPGIRHLVRAMDRDLVQRGIIKDAGFAKLGHVFGRLTPAGARWLRDMQIAYLSDHIESESLRYAIHGRTSGKTDAVAHGGCGTGAILAGGDGGHGGHGGHGCSGGGGHSCGGSGCSSCGGGCGGD
jgi:uncharacterized membrane protein YgcG